MRLLCVLGLARVHPRLVGNGLLAVQLRGLVAGRVDRLLRERRRVGSHVGDVAVLVQPLRHAHGLAGREPQLARGLLLQGRGGERRGRTARVRLRLDAGHREARGVQSQRGGQRLGCCLIERDRFAAEHAAVVEVATGCHALAVEAGELGVEALRARAGGSGQRGHQIPVRRGDEGEPLPLPIDDEPGRGGLHATGGEPRTDLAPEHRRDLESVEAVEDATGLLCVDERGVELAEVLLRALDGLLGDLVEHHPLHGDLRLQHLEEVPRDGLALAVLIRCEVELVGVFEGALQIGDGLLLRVADHVIRSEVVLDVDRELADGALLELGGEVLRLDEVADVPDRGPAPRSHRPGTARWSWLSPVTRRSPASWSTARLPFHSWAHHTQPRLNSARTRPRRSLRAHGSVGG